MKTLLQFVLLTILSIVLIVSIPYGNGDRPEVHHAPTGIPATFMGTGFFINNDGYVVTNNHVVMQDGERSPYKYVVKKGDVTYFATIVYVDTITDLAILKIIGDPIKNDPAKPCLQAAVLDSKIDDRLVFIGYTSDKNNRVMFTSIHERVIKLLSVGEIVGHPSFVLQPSNVSVPVVSNPGNSGSPITNGVNSVVGVLWGVLFGDNGDVFNATVSNDAFISFLQASKIDTVCTNRSTDAKKSIVTIISFFDTDEEGNVQ